MGGLSPEIWNWIQTFKWVLWSTV